MAYRFCGTSTMIYHDEVGFIVFCVRQHPHEGLHKADVTWEQDEDRKESDESVGRND